MPTPAKKNLLLLALLVVATFISGYIWIHWNEETTDDAMIEAHIVPISTKEPGYVTKLNVTDNQSVKQGDVLLEIDPRDYENALSAAKGQLAAAIAAQLKAQTDLNRMQELHDVARSRQMLDDAIAAEETTRANVAIATANETQAEKNLADTKLLAPFDGHVTERTIEPGAYATTGQQLMTIVSDDVWVLANYKETQLLHMRPGQKVDITIDAYPGKIYPGQVDSIMAGTGARFSAFPAENATGNFVKIVQRVPVKIMFTQTPDLNQALGPGMSVIPTVHLQ